MSSIPTGIHDMAPGIPFRIVAMALAPFACGYLLSYLLRAVNAVVAPDLVTDLALSPAELGLLTSAYLLSFALFQLPLGILFDRYGPPSCLLGELPVLGDEHYAGLYQHAMNGFDIGTSSGWETILSKKAG